MAKIRSLGPRELKQVLSLLSRFSQDAPATHTLKRLQSLYLPLHTVNHLLPLPMKFLPEVYVAVEDNAVLSLIWLTQDGSRKDCWRIDEIIINPETDSSLGVTKQLVQYCLSHLGAKGVETFLAYIDIHSPEAISLLKECGFRRCTRMTTWHYEPKENEANDEAERQLKSMGLREASGWDIKLLQSFYEDSLPPEIRVSLRRMPEELHPSLNVRMMNRARGVFHKAWVIPHSSQQYLLAYLAISSHNFKDYRVHLIASPGYDSELKVFLDFAQNQILKNGSRVAITTESYEFQKAWQALLESSEYELGLQTEILVKDVFTPLSQQPENLTSPILLFGGQGGRTSPARG